jgi:hypothetical protein
MKRFVLFGVGPALGLSCSTPHAQVSQLIKYQQPFVASTTNFSGAGTTFYWNNGSVPINPVLISVTNELYSVFTEPTKKTS